jgi:hypothetical protein
VETGEVISRTAYGMCFTSGYLEGDTFYILATFGSGPRLSGDTIRIYSTKGLVNWEQRELFRREGWEFFNTSLTKGEDGYTLLLEVGSSPEDDPGVTFTAYFAKSSDMVNWEMLPFDTAFPKDMYCGAPYMRFHGGYYYIFLLLKLPFRRYAHYIFRTKDFYEIEVGLHNPLLIPSNEDRLISENGKRVYRSRIRLSEIMKDGSVLRAWEISSPYSIQYYCMNEHKGKVYLSFVEDRFLRANSYKGNIAFIPLDL